MVIRAGIGENWQKYWVDFWFARATCPDRSSL
jgi:hypothetical protein